MKDAIIEITDRYKALGVPYPDIETMCKGQCEGLGWVPIHKDDPDPTWRKLWEEQEKIHHEDDGWQFVICPDCKGSGKKNGYRSNNIIGKDD